MMVEELKSFLPLAQKFVDFVNNSVTPFHAIETVKQILYKENFQQINEKEIWNVKPNGKYFFTRNQSTLIAFCIGGKYSSGNGFNIVGAHTDSPNFKIKPNYLVEKESYQQIGVEPYGGGLWTTWFDRDLTIGGRVILKNGPKFESKLIHINRPLLRIPSLAIHLDRDSGTNFNINKQDHCLPIISTIIKDSLEQKNQDKLILNKLLAEELNCSVDDIQDFELFVFDTQKATIGGLYNEFIFSPRLDNLMMSFCGIMALIEAIKNEKILNEEKNIWAVVLFDNEEVGSETAHGASSPIINEFIKRITKLNDLIEISIRKSFFVSADMAHAIHPNYSEKHESKHKPLLHKGVVIKENANQKYSTIPTTAFIIKELAKRNNIPIQNFVIRNDGICGSTIGPIVSSNTGLRTVDIGNPQLSMHSIREMCGISDITYAVNLLKVFFEQFTLLDESFLID